MLTIEVNVVDESIILLSSPVLTTNTVETVQVAFRFGSEWNGYEKTAMFWGIDDEEYAVEVANDCALVPKEVMTEVGKIRFGVYGENGDKRLVSEKASYRIVEGAYFAGRS